MRSGALYSNVQRRAQWVDKEDDAQAISKPDAHEKKVMLCICSEAHEDSTLKCISNTTPHIASATKNELATYGWTVLPHPPYSSDLAPSDYHLFSALQRHLDGQDFKKREEVKAALNIFFESQQTTFWSRGIHDLPKRWQKTIDVNGDILDDLVLLFLNGEINNFVSQVSENFLTT
ncbi:unnamed protein product [Cylicocyclus nassatus]|uniref:Histone-lysine N-methyltransferase SETMAR n=1 Tax=Cylicocyclus nassatus TaxID=53992 RepID=A0AA36GFF1_CYLNA|nr:unnamed protein product [Cylicocyclus nassatus]